MDRFSLHFGVGKNRPRDVHSVMCISWGAGYETGTLQRPLIGTSGLGVRGVHSTVSRLAGRRLQISENSKVPGGLEMPHVSKIAGLMRRNSLGGVQSVVDRGVVEENQLGKDGKIRAGPKSWHVSLEVFHFSTSLACH